MNGQDILDTGILGQACGYWATDADFDRIKKGGLVTAARQIARELPDTRGAKVIARALRENDPGALGGEEIDMIVQTHLFGEIIYG